MELITSSETLDFLSKTAPRAWIKRMLLWMIFTDEIGAYFLEARSIAKTRVFTIVLEALKGDAIGPKREELIREHFNAEMAEKLIAANEMDDIQEIAHEWGRDEQPQAGILWLFCICDKYKLGRRNYSGNNIRWRHPRRKLVLGQRLFTKQ
jgi:hypothetical protein